MDDTLHWSVGKLRCPWVKLARSGSMYRLIPAATVSTNGSPETAA